MKVLIATDDTTFSIGLGAEYRRRGFEVQTGASNLFRPEQGFDLIHCQWPEELCGWRVPAPAAAAQSVLDSLDGWRRSAQVICSVHNLMPHAAKPGDNSTADYYRAFYQRMHHIGHFSETSAAAVAAAFPEQAGPRHFVHGMNLFEETRAVSPSRDEARNLLGLGRSDFALLAFGQLRSHAELTLVHRALARTKVPGRRILFHARLTRGPPLWNTTAHLRQEIWRRRHGLPASAGHLDDRRTAALFQAADVLIIPRSGGHLNSGLLPMAMTFGTPQAAPDYGVYREYLGGGGNALYRPGDLTALIEAIEQLAMADGERARQTNLARAAGWGWGRIVDRILERLAGCDTATPGLSATRSIRT